jgi:hypothetical protein
MIDRLSRRFVRLFVPAAVMALLVCGFILGTQIRPDASAVPDARPVQFRAAPSFDLSNAVIPANEIHAGGPPKDGIPALTDPRMIAAQEAAYLQPGDRVIGVVRGRDARAYPLKILNYHEIVNDRLDGVPIAVTYCPLCDSVAVFDRSTEAGVREFGVSGLVYNSNVLMYDRGGRPESLWSQMKAAGVSGPGASRTLRALPVELTTWQDWQTRYPQTSVLSDQTGHVRDYRTNPYGGYFAVPNLMFPAKPVSDRLPVKSLVLGLWSGGQARAYPLTSFDPQGETLDQQLDGKHFRLAYDGRHRSLRVTEADDGLQWMYSFWFAWYAFRPHTEVYAGK